LVKTGEVFNDRNAGGEQDGVSRPMAATGRVVDIHRVDPD
jgi:hypothetical protein